jgi:hypothetical protein
MVQNYTADLKHALWSLQSAGSHPPFPKSEWKNVLSGMAVNLDIVFSGLFSTLTNDKITTSIGDFDLSVSGSKPSKTIQSHGDWTIAWNTSSSVTVCAFPHWAHELQQYSEYIIQFFGAFPHSHWKVINLDKAVRKFIGEVKNIELSEVSQFTTYKTMEPVTEATTGKRKRSPNLIANLPRLVDNGTAESVTDERQNANTGTFAPSVEESTQERNVRWRIETSKEYMRPKFAQDFIWGATTDNISPASRYSLFAEPLPRPPLSELNNINANKTINENPNLFKIICNINVIRFAELLQDHPNQPFVKSVIVGLTKGFWPWAEPQDGYPVNHNEPQHPPRNDRERDNFLNIKKKKKKRCKYSLGCL